MAEPSSSTQCGDMKLTIEYPSEIENKQQNEMKNKDRHKPSVFAVVIKWLGTAILGIILLASLTVSKISILAISESMNKDDQLDENSICRLFIQLQILMLVPNIVNLTRSIWTGAFRKDLPMPSCRTILCAIPVSVLESVGTCLFIFNIPGLTRAHHIMLLMNCVFLIPLIDNLIQSYRKRNDPNKKRWIALFAFGILLESVGISFTIFLLSHDKPTSKQWMSMFVGIFSLSLTWTPSVNRYLLGPENAKSSYADVGQSNSSTHAQGIEHSDISNPSIQQPGNDTNPQSNACDNSKERVTWKLTIIMSIVKIFSTFGISMLIFNVEYLSPFPRNTTVNIYDYANGWKLSVWDDSRDQDVYYFTAHIISSLISYLTGYMACTTCMQIGAFALPLVSATIPSLILLTVTGTCESLLMRINGTHGNYSGCSFTEENNSSHQAFLIVAGICLLIAQIIVTLRQIWKNGTLVKLKECQDEHEMRQLLESIYGVVQTKKEKHIEAHIIFDNAISGEVPTEYALQLLYLIEDVLGVQFNADCTKRKTPYGMSLKWTLYETSNGDAGNTEGNKMDLTIHLKDNTKVKSKKRWSQVMYMSYVLDILLERYHATDEDVFILTTDADVKFTPDSIAYLLDLMARDDTVGAVCARTYPLGSGPIAWYQAFEYAIGHWFQKAAEHVIGSVLCSPGCFSVYRCKAIREVIRTYASDVEHAFDFLTKDMGEDRWLCTLMVQTGRRIDYCAASENSTHCPESFSEFFKQRRRWVVSTLANMILLLQEWNKVHRYNHRVSFVFLVYQAILLFATLIGPSSVILVVCGGLKYAWNWNPQTALILQVVICIFFTIVCLTCQPNIQINTAMVLTFFYAAIMTAVLVGTALEIRHEYNGKSESNSTFISSEIKISTTTAYLSGLVGIFLVTGTLHLKECVYLLHAIWYLLCLPSGYLLLIIYSICNITDKSWGTREEKQDSDFPSNHQDWFANIKKRFYSFCCNTPLEEITSKELQNDEANSDKDREETMVKVLRGADSASTETDRKSQREKKMEKVRKTLKGMKFDELLDPREEWFWKKLIETSLKPNSFTFGSDKTLKEKLCALRNTWLIVFVLSNMLWLILITTLANEVDSLDVFGSNPVGFVVVIVFGFVLVIQFLAMIFHRFSTLKHYLARAPYFRGSGKNVIWEYVNKRDIQTKNKTRYQRLTNDTSD